MANQDVLLQLVSYCLLTKVKAKLLLEVMGVTFKAFLIDCGLWAKKPLSNVGLMTEVSICAIS